MAPRSIGVVADVRYEEVETSVKPDVYLPLLQSMRASGYLFVRGRVGNDALVPAIRAEVQAMDADLPVTDRGRWRRGSGTRRGARG